MVSILKLLDEKILFPLRFNYLSKILLPYLDDCKSVLDLGASCGRLAKKIQERAPRLKFVGVDTCVQPETFIEIKKYNGKTLPFRGGQFDCVMMVDVLHHDKDPGRILREARRVSKRYILIKDHYWDTKFDFKLLKYSDYIGNKPYGVSLPYNFLRLRDWRELFKKNNLNVVSSRNFRYNMLDPCKHVVFKLMK